MQYPLKWWSGYGYLFMQRTFYGIWHRGVDFVVDKGKPVKASVSGKCVSRWGPQGGRQVWQYSNGGHHINHIADVLRYMHLSKTTFSGEKCFKQGEIIGYTGNSGIFTTGPHLHFDLQINGQYVDPLKYLKKEDMTKEEVKKFCDKRYAKKDIRVNFDPKDGSYWLCGNNKKYKIGTLKDDYLIVIGAIAGENINEVEKKYKRIYDRREILKK